MSKTKNVVSVREVRASVPKPMPKPMPKPAPKPRLKQYKSVLVVRNCKSHPLSISYDGGVLDLAGYGVYKGCSDVILSSSYFKDLVKSAAIIYEKVLMEVDNG